MAEAGRMADRGAFVRNLVTREVILSARPPAGERLAVGEGALGGKDGCGSA